MELLANAGRMVTREDLQQKLWPADTFVDFDVGLNTAIRKLRQALGDDAESPRYIETLAKRGYRFIGIVEIPTVTLSVTVGIAPLRIQANRIHGTVYAGGCSPWQAW